MNGTPGSVRKRSTSGFRVLSRSSRLWPTRRGGRPRGLAFARAGWPSWNARPSARMRVVASFDQCDQTPASAAPPCSRARFTAWQARRSRRCILPAQSSFSISTSAFSSRRWCALHSACSTPLACSRASSGHARQCR